MKLILSSDAFPDRFIVLRESDLPIVIGRSAKVGLAIDDALLSRRHSEIFADEKAFHIRDLESTNLTILNEHEVTEQPLCDGDRLLLGETLILVQVQLADEDAAAIDAETREIPMKREVIQADTTSTALRSNDSTRNS